ncbi:MAG TPA: plastocyanin/azurin family copper-binding protein [Caulobacteraceae bacterium]|jgi:plastocyanin
MTLDKPIQLATAMVGLIAASATLAALGRPAVAWAASFAISQHNLQFSQSTISIHQGDTLSFSNQDNVSHNISVRGGDDTDDLGVQKPRDVVSYKFTDKRIYSVVCSIHPGMRLRVIVN